MIYYENDIEVDELINKDNSIKNTQKMFFVLQNREGTSSDAFLNLWIVFIQKSITQKYQNPTNI